MPKVEITERKLEHSWSISLVSRGSPSQISTNFLDDQVIPLTTPIEERQPLDMYLSFYRIRTCIAFSDTCHCAPRSKMCCTCWRGLSAVIFSVLLLVHFHSASVVYQSAHI